MRSSTTSRRSIERVRTHALPCLESPRHSAGGFFVGGGEEKKVKARLVGEVSNGSPAFGRDLIRMARFLQVNIPAFSFKQVQSIKLEGESDFMRKPGIQESS